MTLAQVAGTECPQGLLSHLLFQTNDADEAREGMTNILSSHELRIADSKDILDSCLYHVPLGGITLNRLRYGTAVDIYPGYGANNFYLVEIPISGGCKVSCGNNAVDSNPRMAAVVSPMHPLQLHWHSGCDKIIFKIDRPLLERHCAQHLGHPLTRPVYFNVGMDLESSQAQSFRRLLSLLVAEVDHGGAMLDSPIILSNFLQMIVGALLFTQPNNYTNDLTRPTASIAPFYVKRAEEYMLAHASEPITVVELAEHVGASTRSLHGGFQNFRGITPMLFLKSVRLERVRQDLLAAPERGTVTSVAMRWGFRHLGHFTTDYKRMFGETPSQTLRASRPERKI